MKKTYKELIQKTVPELEKERQTLKEDILRSALSAVSSPQKDSNIVSKKKKRIAMVQTAINERKLADILKKAVNIKI